MAIRAPHKRTAILRGHSALAALWLLHAVSLCQHVSGVTHLELPDFHGRKSGGTKCCKQSEACQAIVRTDMNSCSQNSADCDCEQVKMDFAVSGIGASREKGLKELGSSLSVSSNGNLMAVGGKGGAWASTSSASLSSVLYDGASKLVEFAEEPSANVAVVAGDDMICFGQRSRVRCTYPAPTGGWLDVVNAEMPSLWTQYWGKRNFIVNTVINTAECQCLCDQCYASNYGTPYFGNGAGCYGIDLAIDAFSVAIAGRQSNKGDACGYKGFVQVRTAAAVDGERRWRSVDESAHLEYEGEASFGESLALQGNLLAVGVPDRNENSPGNPFDVPGAVILFRLFSDTRYAIEHRLPAPADCRNFGREVSLHGSTLVVGAPGNSTLGASVHVYRVQDALTPPKHVCAIREPTAQAEGFGSKGTISQTQYGGESFLLLGSPKDELAHIIRVAANTDVCQHLTALKGSAQDVSGQAHTGYRFGAATAIGNGLALVSAPGYRSYWNPCPGQSCINGLLYFRAQCWEATQSRQQCDKDMFLQPGAAEERYECSSAASDTCQVPSSCQFGSQGLCGMVHSSPGVVIVGPVQMSCGNARKEVGNNEACDDGNTESGDGCSRVCQVELGFRCMGGSAATADGCVVDQNIFLDRPHIRGTFTFENMLTRLSDVQQLALKEGLAKFGAKYDVEASTHVMIEDMKPSRNRRYPVTLLAADSVTAITRLLTAAGIVKAERRTARDLGTVKIAVLLPKTANDAQALGLLGAYREAVQSGDMIDLLYRELVLIPYEIVLEAKGKQGQSLGQQMKAVAFEPSPSPSTSPVNPLAIAQTPEEVEGCEGGIPKCYAATFIGVFVPMGAFACACSILMWYKHRKRRGPSSAEILQSVVPSSQAERDRRLQESMAHRSFGMGPAMAGRPAANGQATASLGLASAPSNSRATGAVLLGGTARKANKGPRATEGQGAGPGRFTEDGKPPPYAIFRKKLQSKEKQKQKEREETPKVCMACILGQQHDRCIWVFPDMHQLAEEGNAQLAHQLMGSTEPAAADGPPQPDRQKAKASEPKRQTQETEKECLVCLGTFGPGDQIRVLPCMHTFHKECVDEWLNLGHNDCPLCKQEVNAPLKVNSEFQKEVESRLGVDLSDIASSRAPAPAAPRAGRRPIRQVLEEIEETAETEVPRPPEPRGLRERGAERRQRGGGRGARDERTRGRRERGERRHASREASQERDAADAVSARADRQRARERFDVDSRR